MRIAICTSMVFSEKMLEVKRDLEKLGHKVFISRFTKEFLGKTTKQKERLAIFEKNSNDAIRDFFQKIKKSDAILVLNLDRHGIKNYVGGNTLMEIGFAHVLGKKIFLLNPIPKIVYYKSEIYATKPVISRGNLKKIN